MRDTAFSIIKTAAEEVGLQDASVIEKPWKKGGSILLPDPRMEVEWMGESLKRSGRRLAVVAGSDPLRSRTVRRALYTAELTARCELVSEDPDWVEVAYRRYILALPRKVGDSNNDLVVVTANRAVRSGFVSGLVDVGRRRSNAVYVVFRGMISRDESVPWIRDAHIVPYWGGFLKVIRTCYELVPVLSGDRSRSVADVFVVDASPISELSGRFRSESAAIERSWLGWWEDGATWESPDSVVAVEGHSEW